MTTFSYKSNSVFNDQLFTILIAIFLIIGPIVYPFGLRIGRLHILGPLPTTILCIGVGVYLLFTVLQAVCQARALSAKGGVITIDDDTVTYPTAKEQATFKISEVSNIGGDEGILTITLANGAKVTFDMDSFESNSKVKEFVALIQK